MKKYVPTSLEEFREAETYWLEKLSGELKEIKFYRDFPGGSQLYTGEIFKETPYRTLLKQDQAARLSKISRNNSLSMYVILLACFKILVFKYLGQNDIITAAPVYNITNQWYNRYVFFRDAVHSHMTCKGLVDKVKETVVNGYKNEHFPLKKVIDRLELPEGMSLARAVFLFEEIHDRKFLKEIRKEHQNDITFLLRQKDGSQHGILEAAVSYNSSVFKPGTMENMPEHYQMILNQVLNNPGQHINNVELISPEEKSKIIFEFNRHETDYPVDKTIHQLFEEQAKQTPHQPAVGFIPDLSDIYKELKKETLNVNHQMWERIGTCSFKTNPFVFTFDIPPRGEGKPLKLLKTHRHTGMIVNNNVVELLNLLDGKQSLGFIFNRIKQMHIPMYVYPVNIDDLLEISGTFSKSVEKFSSNDFGEFIGLVKLLYRNYLIDIAGYGTGDFPAEHIKDNFDEAEGFDEAFILDDFFNRGQRLSGADVLLIGDTPGMPSVGLLYMASYLWRNGIKALCHFHDRNEDYDSFKKDIHHLLDNIRPRVVGVSMKWFPYMARVLDLCKIVKAHSPGIKIVLGGNTASYYCDKVITYDCIDYVIRGDGEVPLLRICQETDELPNCIYKKNGKIIENPITYVHNETNSKEIYLSHLDRILISRYASCFGTFFIPTQRGCTLNCCYCGGCRGAQEKTFGRKRIFKRGIEEVRKDIIEARKYASLFMFDLIESNEYYLDYFKKITEGIDLTGHFCVYGNYILPSAGIVDLMSRTFKYVYWELDLASLSQRHRDQLVLLDLVKVQPSDKEILDFYDVCEGYANGEVRMNLIAGLPYFNRDDIEESHRMLKHIITHYRCFFDFHWGRLHAQPGAPIVEEAVKHRMYSYAATYEDFLRCSEMNFDRESRFPGVEDYNYPYVYFQDEALNSAISQYSAETRAIITRYKEKKRQNILVENKLTYRELDEQANRLAMVLREKGIIPGSIVALIMESSLEMAVSILAVLKAGGAYLPIDSDYPQERIDFMLKDSNARMILKKSEIRSPKSETNPNDPNSNDQNKRAEVSVLDFEHLNFEFVSNFEFRASNFVSSNLAYLIYTSGTTGKPKGVLIEHRGLVNYITWRIRAYNHTGADVTLQPLSYSFDGFASNFYSSLLSGGKLILVPGSKRMDFDFMKEVVKQCQVTNTSLVPRMFAALLEHAQAGELECLRFVVLGGELAPVQLVQQSKARIPGLQHIVEFGPTEATVTAAVNLSLDETNPAVVGRPIDNVNIFITDHMFRMQPIGIVGQLCIGGIGLARGYLNNPELTAQKFQIPKKTSFNRSYRSYKSYILYQTGDLARWLSSGSIEFFGRRDHQVKIRGFRVELEEIQHHLLAHDGIKEAVVLAKEVNSEPSICAYIAAAEKIDAVVVREFMAKRLPAHMLPSYIIEVDHIPLTTHGKPDTGALPAPGSKAGEDNAGIAPRNEIEEKLAQIWSEVLDIEKETIEIDANFFLLGGHSLKGINMLTQIHKVFDTKISFAEVFKNLTIRELSQRIEKLAPDRFISIKATEKKEYYRLSSSQKRLYILQQMETGNISYNIPFVVSLPGDNFKNKLEKIFKELISRHESLRTSFPMVNGEPVQRVHRDVSLPAFQVEEIEGTRGLAPLPMDLAAGMIRNFIRPFDLSQAPLLRVGLIKQTGNQFILLIDMHHIITDGTSQVLLTEEFMALDAGEGLSLSRLQYRDYSEWQQGQMLKGALKSQETYWLDQFKGRIPVLNLPTDYPVPPVRRFEGETMEFEIGEALTGQLKEISESSAATMFMVLFALFNVFLAKLCGQEDIIAATVVEGRNHADLNGIVGMFVNTLALRNFPSSDKTFVGFLEEVKQRTIKAYENQSYPYEDLVNKIVTRRDASQLPLCNVGFIFQALDPQEPGNEPPGGVETQTLPYKYENKTSKGDLTLHATYTKDKLRFSVEYWTKLFKKKTIQGFIEDFKQVLLKVLNNKEVKLKEIISPEGHDTIWEEQKEFPAHKTIHQLFEEQVERTPGNTALITGGRQVTYGELNKKANRLARILRKKGVGRDKLVGLLIDRSMEMIVGILAILKAGGAYLPIDTTLPIDRVLAILEDCRVFLLLTHSTIFKKYSFKLLKSAGAGSVESMLRLTASRPQVPDFDKLPIPDRSLVNYEKYSHHIGVALAKKVVSLQATRGCPYQCAYCHKIWPKTHIYRSAENIFAEVRLLYDLGIRRFAIVDDIFNLKSENSKRFFQLVIDNGLEIQLFFPAGMRGDILTKEFIDLMVEAGLVCLPLALETGSPRLQKLIKRNLHLERFRENIEYFCQKHPHVILDLFTMLGFPGETEEEAMMTLDFIKSIKWLHFPYIFVLHIYPGTDMEKLALESGITARAMARSKDLYWHELPDTLPFSKAFAKKYQADFLDNYFLLKERLLHVLPYQMKVLTEEEVLQKYNTYLPVTLESVNQLLEFAGIEEEELGAKACVDDSWLRVPDLDEKIKGAFPSPEPRADALRVLLLDLSQYFSRDSDPLNELVEPPLGLMYIMTYLKQQFGRKVKGKLAKSQVDFDNYKELKELLDDFRPQIIGMRTLTYYENFFHQIAAAIRQWGYDVPIIAGGPYATSSYATILQDRNINAVVLGEGEITFAELIEKVMENNGQLPGDEVLRDIPGIAFVPREAKINTMWTNEMVIMDLAGWETEENPGNLEPINQSTDLAYVIFTSGSTGKPKGVGVQHQGVVNMLTARQQEYQINPQWTALQLFPYHFDGFVTSFFTPIISGSRVILLNEDEVIDIAKIKELIVNFRVNHFISIPEFYRLIIEDLSKEEAASLEVVTLAGEKIGSGILHRTRDINERIEIVNEYGVTEISVLSTLYRHQQRDDTIKIGRPIQNTLVYIRGEQGQPQPVGVPGELCIGGVGTARGYLNNPELTAEKFDHDLWDYLDYQDKKVPGKKSYVRLEGTRGLAPLLSGKNPMQPCIHASMPSLHHPITPIPHYPIYHTGDLARWLPDGNIEFLGRIDLQVKIRGARIELEEIERRLVSHEAIKDAVVVAREDKEKNKYLAAYYIERQHNREHENDYQVKENSPHLWPSVAEFFVYDDLLYYAMTNDEQRNEKYKAAINRLVKDKVVLDIGTGKDAILARFCVEAGASKVYAVEILEESFQQAKERVGELGLEKQVELIYGDITKIQLPEKVDVCVSEIVGSIGGSEGAAAILNHARGFLAEDGVMIPVKSITKIAGVCLPDPIHKDPRFFKTPGEYVKKIFNHVGYPFDLRICIKHFPGANLISEAGIFEHLDFTGMVQAGGIEEVTLAIEKAARLDGFLVWLTLHTTDHEVIDTLKHEHCWLPVFIPVFYPGIDVSKGDVIRMECIRTPGENKVNPDYKIKGMLTRENQGNIEFEYWLPHFKRDYRQTPFYQALFKMESSPGKLTAKELREFLEGALPGYAVPRYFESLERFPLTSAGKVDRNALPQPGTRETMEYAQPGNETEHIIARTWQEVLQIDEVSIHANFFDLGGNSLDIIKVNSRLKKEIGRDIPVAKLFKYPTIHLLADFLSQEQEQELIPEKRIKETLNVMDETLQLLQEGEDE